MYTVCNLNTLFKPNKQMDIIVKIAISKERRYFTHVDLFKILIQQRCHDALTTHNPIRVWSDLNLSVLINRTINQGDSLLIKSSFLLIATESRKNFIFLFWFDFCFLSLYPSARIKRVGRRDYFSRCSWLFAKKRRGKVGRGKTIFNWLPSTYFQL